MVIEMISIDVPGLMMIFATAIMAYLIICFVMGTAAAIYIHFRYLIHPIYRTIFENIALNNVEKYQDYIEYFGLEESNKNQTVKPLLFNSLTTETNYGRGLSMFESIVLNILASTVLLGVAFVGFSILGVVISTIWRLSINLSAISSPLLFGSGLLLILASGNSTNRDISYCCFDHMCGRFHMCRR